MDAIGPRRDPRSVPRYLHVWLVLALLAGCDGAGDTGASPTETASERPAPAAGVDAGSGRERVFAYEVRGRARGVKVTYVDGKGHRVRRRVDTPWTSRDMTARANMQLRITARAPTGSYIECVLKHRRPRGRYGGNGSGESSHISDSPHRCDLDNVTPD